MNRPVAAASRFEAVMLSGFAALDPTIVAADSVTPPPGVLMVDSWSIFRTKLVSEVSLTEPPGLETVLMRMPPSLAMKSKLSDAPPNFRTAPMLKSVSSSLTEKDRSSAEIFRTIPDKSDVTDKFVKSTPAMTLISKLEPSTDTSLASMSIPPAPPKPTFVAADKRTSPSVEMLMPAAASSIRPPAEVI